MTVGFTRDYNPEQKAMKARSPKNVVTRNSSHDTTEAVVVDLMIAILAVNKWSLDRGMLIDVFDKLTSGRRIRAIVYDGGEIHVPVGNEGTVVDYHDGVLNADAWVCYGEDGISLSTNARVNGGLEGFETPLANIRHVVFMPDRR